MRIFSTLDANVRNVAALMRAAGNGLCEPDEKRVLKFLKGSGYSGNVVSEILKDYEGVHGVKARDGSTPDIIENKLRTLDMSILRVAERKVLSLNLAKEFNAGPPVGLEPDYVTSLHERLYSDLYPSAGKYRTSELSGDFSPVDDIPDGVEKALDRAYLNFRRKSDRQAAGEVAARLFYDLLHIQPFEHGNLITAAAFTMKVLYSYGYSSDLRDITEAELGFAVRAYHAGRYDLLEGVFGMPA